MQNESTGLVRMILTDEELKNHLSYIERHKSTVYQEVVASLINNIGNSHRSLNSRNAKLVHENDELMAENMKLKEEIKELNHYAELSHEQSNNLKDQIEALEEHK